MQILHEYKNDFLYFVIGSDKDRGEGALVCCSGVNISRFSPIVKGRHGIGSNAAVRGLQLTNHSLRALALTKGATPRGIRGKDCAGIAPLTDTWYTDLLLIENAPDSFPEEIINYCGLSLLRKIFKACMLEVQLPGVLPEPEELQRFLEEQCRRFGG